MTPYAPVAIFLGVAAVAAFAFVLVPGLFARRKPNQHADPVCLLRLLGSRRQRAERYST